jgi:NADH-quinone oxidoreductase subunit H
MNTLESLTSLLIFPAGLTLLLAGMLYDWFDRKLVARFQNRVGPRWFQPIADVIKLFAKEQITPEIKNPALFIGLPSPAR